MKTWARFEMSDVITFCAHFIDAVALGYEPRCFCRRSTERLTLADT